MAELNSTMGVGEGLELDSLNSEGLTYADSDDSNYEDDLNDEALDALEASLKQKLESLVLEQKEFEEITDAGLLELEACNAKVLEETEEITRKIAMVEAETVEIINSRDQSLSDLRSVEQAFSDVHRKYERAKLGLGNATATEEVYKQEDEHLQITIAEKDRMIKDFQEEISIKLEETDREGTIKLKNLERENAKLQAVHRRAEMRVETLEFELTQKKNEKNQMNNLADELIGKNARGGI